MGRAEVEDDGEVRRPVHDYDGEKGHRVSLVLFSHSVSEHQLISCVFAHNLFQLLFKFALKIFYGSIAVEIEFH